MRKILFLTTFCIVVFNVGAHAQLFQVGHVTYTVTDSVRNRSIPLEIYYPADVAGDNLPMTSTSGAFPVLSFGHGFVMTWDSYQNIWQALVPHGYIMVFPKTETGFSPSHLEFGKDLAFAIQQMQRYNADAGSIFYNRVGSASCVMGHSMGGGASFLSLPFNSQISALATLAPAETNPSAVTAAAGITVPSLIMAGELDCVTPPATNQILMYNALASNCKSLVTIVGGIHCQMANSNVLCNFGEASCLPANSISVSSQHATIERFLIPWLDYTLKNDCRSGSVFDSLLVNDAAVTSTNNCVRCDSLNQITEAGNGRFQVNPNPFSGKLIISGQEVNSAKIAVLNINGKNIAVDKRVVGDHVELNTLNWPDGVYFIQLTVGRKTYCYKRILSK